MQIRQRCGRIAAAIIIVIIFFISKVMGVAFCNRPVLRFATGGVAICNRGLLRITTARFFGRRRQMEQICCARLATVLAPPAVSPDQASLFQTAEVADESALVNLALPKILTLIAETEPSLTSDYRYLRLIDLVERF